MVETPAMAVSYLPHRTSYWAIEPGGYSKCIYVYDRADGVLSSNTRIFDNCRENHTAGLMAFILIIWMAPTIILVEEE